MISFPASVRPAVCSLLRTSSRPKSKPPLRASFPTSSAAVATVAASMAAYSVAVADSSLGAVPDGDPKAHHVKKHGQTVKFRNQNPSVGELADASALSMLRRMAVARWRGQMPSPDVGRAEDIPRMKPQFLQSRNTQNQPLRATWLGHACYYVEFPGGLRVLFDPVFEDRCSPTSFYGPKRFMPPPCKLSELPIVDAVVISHSHYDHLSHPSVLEIHRHHPEAHFFVGLGLEKWFRSSGVMKVTEMDWWQDVKVTLQPASKKGAGEDAEPEKIEATFSCLPCQHASGRTTFDKDTTLWASWAVSSGGKSVWFGGDSGYRAVPMLPEGVDGYGPEYASLPRCPQFAQIGRLRGPFDLGLIPIGAYSPRYLWSPYHADPYDAVEMFKDTQCKEAMGIHWGTWMLTSEKITEPPMLLKQALAKAGMPENGVFDTCGLGETRDF